MDKVVKVLSAKKKLQHNNNYNDNNDINSNNSKKQQEQVSLSNEDFAFGYLLAHIKRESEKSIIGNSWTALMDEILEDEDDKKLSLTNDNNNSLTPFAPKDISSNSPFGASQLRTPSPVFNNSFATAAGGSATLIGHKNSFKAQAPSPRPKKTN